MIGTSARGVEFVGRRQSAAIFKVQTLDAGPACMSVSRTNFLNDERAVVIVDSSSLLRAWRRNAGSPWVGWLHGLIESRRRLRHPGIPQHASAPPAYGTIGCPRPRSASSCSALLESLRTRRWASRSSGAENICRVALARRVLRASPTGIDSAATTWLSESCGIERAKRRAR